jgi:NitT/TauT family transport system permease protein/taurine transport system permease protein
VKKDRRYLLLSLLAVSTVLAAWWLATDILKLVPATTFPSPVRVLRTLVIKFWDPNPDGATLPEHVLASLQVSLTGYLMGVFIGVPLGICMAWFTRFDWFARPLFDMLRPIPGIAWIPLMIILFGIGVLSKAMVIFLSSFTACVVNSYSGIKQTKAVHLWVARTFGAGNLEMLFKIAIPTSLPLVLTGMRVALGSSWSALVAAELLASTQGLGFMIMQCRGLYRPDVIIAGMITIGSVGAFLTWLLSLLERRVVKGGRFS